MIEVRFFATLRNGRGKITEIPAEEAPTAGDILRRFDIPAEEVAILLINGFHSKPEDPVKDGDIISLFPPVGGG
ncbi:MAG: MoaD/ThiS family protein [Oscillospiraceae bacterium]|nr:MoaD/ThiS family protein [Oscillospiraceae bacterium]MBO7373960.1 MoaD/ThiS family protein [Oscillospiraceae bacterium]MBP5240081.1 MoaD/ThiS family protein [Oscillospiraceae bacterium]